MVSASKGVIVQCDIPTKVLIASLNEGCGTGDRVVLRELDDTTLLINPKFVDLVKEALQKHTDKNTFAVPVQDKRL
ncbi:hypothetical protein FOA52_013518 [Chlamydomonas sp. UWO 241]|nr:hypothetical protein FOA52_013518 [Chlamydomonas sp. UWO 241]